MNQFNDHQYERNLVSISRNAIDNNEIQGFVIKSSDQLVAIQYVYDFHLDGLIILRVADITGVRCSETDRYQKRMLEEEGMLQNLPFDAALDLSNWRAAIFQLANKHELMILECETGEDEDDAFFIGRATKATKHAVHFEHFSGTAEWYKEPAKVSFADITSCQFDTNYVNFYQRHFERSARGE